MKLRLERLQLDSDVTIGSLTVDGDWECWALEDAVREIPGVGWPAWKIPGKTAIGYGRYPVDITMSQRFQRELPILFGVSGFSGVRIHPGNTAADTEGCILVGQDRHAKSLGNSRKAFAALFAQLRDAQARGQAISIEIVRGGTP